MDAAKDFGTALTEVDALLAISRRHDTLTTDRPALIKAGLLLLTAKLECFFEAIVEEYCDLACATASATHLPEAIRISASRKLFIDKKLEIEHPNGGDAAATFRKIADLWKDTRPCPSISVDSKFSYGRHGEQQVIKLFRRIGIADVFEQFPIEDEPESLASPSGASSIAPDFNSLSSIRNNIIHSDATPALTEEDIERHKRRFLLFVQKLESHLEASLAIPTGDGFFEI